jgi:hypothetical protein
MDRIAQLCKDTGYDPQKLYAVYKVTAPTVATAPAMIKSLEKMLGKMLDEQTKANS